MQEENIYYQKTFTGEISEERTSEVWNGSLICIDKKKLWAGKLENIG